MFITLEGPDGSGKTSQISLMVEYLRRQGFEILQTREPGGTASGDQIRETLHRLDNTAMHPRTEILLYAASRAQLVHQVIKPHLADGGIVICDRYSDSTLAYQGYGHGLDLTILRQILSFATDGLKPDLTLYFDISVDEAIERRKRASNSGEEWNRMDALAIEFHRRVREGYSKLIAAEPDRWVTIDATQPIEIVQHQACQIV